MKIARKKAPQPAIPLCSTAHIAFLLLIFFIVLCKGVAEQGVDWRRPVAAVKLSSADSNNVSVTIDRHNAIFINGHDIQPPAVREVLTSYLTGKPVGKRIVLLKVDREVPERVFSSVMLDIAAVGGEMFRVLDVDPNKPR